MDIVMAEEATASIPTETPILELSAHDERPCLMSAPKDTNNIESAAGEWLPDTTLETSTTLEAATLAPETVEAPRVTGPVTFVMDPYGINTLEISDAQNQDHVNIDDEEILEEESEEEIAENNDDSEKEAETEAEEAPLEFVTVAETDAQLDRLSQAIAADEVAIAAETQEIEAQLAAEQAKLLADQIAEDEALAKAMAEEAEEIDPELLAALPHRDANGNLDLQEMCSCIQALLFMLDKPVSAKKLQDLLTIPSASQAEQQKKIEAAAEEGTDTSELEAALEAELEASKPDFSLIQEALTALKQEYSRSFHGFELVEVAGGYQFRTKPGRAALAKKLAKIQTQRLSSGAMETLAIVAYKQPVLKEDIDKVRGVDSSHFIRGLMDKKLIAISGRSDLPGRPMLYTTTQAFLELFGLKDLSAMPPLAELEQMVPTSQSDRGEDPRVLKMRTLVAEMNSDKTRLDYNPREDEVILKDIRDRVSQIPTSTPYLDEQKAIEKAVALAKAEGREIPEDLTLLLRKPEPVVVQASETGASE